LKKLGPVRYGIVRFRLGPNFARPDLALDAIGVDVTFLIERQVFMLRILHLEDSKEDAMLIEHTVKSEGIKATFKVVKNRQDFISECEKEQFDVVLADSSTTDFDGISALKMVRQKNPHTPFICLSGRQDPSHIKECFDAGATDYVSKNDLSPLITTLRIEAERVGN